MTVDPTSRNTLRDPTPTDPTQDVYAQRAADREPLDLAEDSEGKARDRGMSTDYAFERVTKQIAELSTERCEQARAMLALAEEQRLTRLRVDAAVVALHDATTGLHLAAQEMNAERDLRQAEPWRYRIVQRLATAFEAQPIWSVVLIGVAGIVAYILGINFAELW